MWLCILISAATCLTMIASVLFFPKIKIGNVHVASYWVITLVGAAVLLATGEAHVKTVGAALVANTAVNPLKILVLFLCMTVLSLYLDELGFFRYLAGVALRRAKRQKRLFVTLYITVAVLTVFTSNDVIVLSFTPFICYFARAAKIDPVPYLAAEFVAANTWSMALIIGNPTNIYLTTAYGIGFVEYLKGSILPTLAAGLVAFGALYLLFRKKLTAPVTAETETPVLSDKPLLWVGVAHLAVCTLFLALGSYIGVEMWLVSLCALVSLVLVTALVCLFRHRPPRVLWCLPRAPFALVPFILSMFVLITALNENGVTAAIAKLLDTSQPILSYGLVSFLAANLINNIPMSVLFSSVLEGAPLSAAYAVIIGSNIGAFFTPIGALAGIMWSNLLRRQNVKFSYFDFLKIGVTVAVPTLFAALAMLYIVV